MSVPFSGFPNRGQFVSIPDAFFTSLLPQIKDPVELRVSLHLFRHLYRRRGYPRFVTRAELLADGALMLGLQEGGHSSAADVLDKGLEQAVARGTFLHLALGEAGKIDHLYFMNREEDRRAMGRIAAGELDLGRLPQPEPAITRERPNIFVLYENNIGLLTPLLAEELAEAEQLYPAEWIEDAFKEAVELNRRSWRYISRILERWGQEGRGDGETRRHPGAIDPDKYIKGKYGRIVRR